MTDNENPNGQQAALRLLLDEKRSRYHGLTDETQKLAADIANYLEEFVGLEAEADGTLSDFFLVPLKMIEHVYDDQGQANLPPEGWAGLQSSLLHAAVLGLRYYQRLNPGLLPLLGAVTVFRTLVQEMIDELGWMNRHDGQPRPMPVSMETIPEYADLLTVDQGESPTAHGIGPDDGHGYWARLEQRHPEGVVQGFMDNEADCFGPRPPWATHVAWFNK